jgi:hypothetical protein
MDTLRALMELYGAFDQALIDDDDPDLAVAVDKLFPGSSSNRGWYDELETFFFSETASGPRQSADATAALATLAAADQTRPLTATQKSQLFMNLVSLYQVQQSTGTTALPSYDDDEGFQTAFDSAFDRLRPPLAEPAASGSTEPAPVAEPATVRRASIRGKTTDADDGADDDAGESLDIGPLGSLSDFLTIVRQEFNDRADFQGIAQKAIQFRLVDPEVADIPLCEAYLATVGGVPCVVVDTAFTSEKVSLEQVLGIVNPFNWHDNYPDFFCGMTGCAPPRSDGWGRVLENVSFCGWQGVRGLSTSLKFNPKRVSPLDARLDYDLDDPTPGPGDGQVTVDRGYVNVTCTAKSKIPTDKGVQINTRKVVHIRNIAPYAQARLVCITGYGSASVQFICGAAEIRPPGPKPFDYLGEAGGGTGGTGATGTPPPHAVPGAVQIWTKTLQDVTNSYVALAGKWTSGGLTIKDVADYSKDVGGRLASTPWEILQAVTQPRPPSNPNQGQGGGT